MSAFEDDLAAALEGYSPTSIDRMLLDGDAMFARVPVAIEDPDAAEVIERRMLEFNPCHEPAGPDGGQFTFKGTGNCGPDGTPSFPRQDTVLIPVTRSHRVPGKIYNTEQFDAASGRQVLGGLSAEDAGRTMVQYMTEPMHVEVQTLEGQAAVYLRASATKGKTYLTRTITREPDGRLVAHHAHFENHGPAEQGKALMQGQMELYEKLGLDTVTATANISTGAYAWARYGFVAAEPTVFAESVRHRIGAQGLPTHNARLLAGNFLTVAMREEIRPYLPQIQAALATPDAQTPWRIADLRVHGTPRDLQPLVEAFRANGSNGRIFNISVSQGTKWNQQLQAEAARGVFNLGRALLTGMTWTAELPLKDTAAMARLRGYLRTSKTKEAGLREYNDCNLPGGYPDGGQFGANADPRCAGENKGSLYYGPVRPPRGKDLVRWRQRHAGRMLRRSQDAFISPPTMRPQVGASGTKDTGKEQFTAHDRVASLYFTGDRDAFQRVTKGLTPEQFAYHFTKYMAQAADVSIGLYSDRLEIQVKAGPRTRRTSFSRTFTHDGTQVQSVYHSYFVNQGPAGQGKGVMRAQAELYEHLKLAHADVGAGLSMGGYAWARYGFSVKDPSDIRRSALDRVNRLASPYAIGQAGVDLMAPYLARIRAVIENPEAGEQLSWHVADLRIKGTPEQMQKFADAFKVTPDRASQYGATYEERRQAARLNQTRSVVANAYRVGTPKAKRQWDKALQADADRGVFNVGRLLLAGTSWSGRLYMQKPASRARLKAYVGDWTTTPISDARPVVTPATPPAREPDITDAIRTTQRAAANSRAIERTQTQRALDDTMRSLKTADPVEAKRLQQTANNLRIRLKNLSGPAPSSTGKAWTTHAGLTPAAQRAALPDATPTRRQRADGTWWEGPLSTPTRVVAKNRPWAPNSEWEYKVPARKRQVSGATTAPRVHATPMPRTTLTAAQKAAGWAKVPITDFGQLASWADTQPAGTRLQIDTRTGPVTHVVDHSRRDGFPWRTLTKNWSEKFRGDGIVGGWRYQPPKAATLSRLDKTIRTPFKV